MHTPNNISGAGQLEAYVALIKRLLEQYLFKNRTIYGDINVTIIKKEYINNL